MLMSYVMTKLHAWNSYRETVYQLESLADRDLSDLGIGRRDIKRIAREATGKAQIRARGTAPALAMRIGETSHAR